MNMLLFRTGASTNCECAKCQNYAIWLHQSLKYCINGAKAHPRLNPANNQGQTNHTVPDHEAHRASGIL